MSNENSHNAIDSLILMNEIQQLTPSYLESLGDFNKNQPNTANLANKVGSIGPMPNMFGGLGEEELLDIVMSSVTRSPMMGSIRGGKAAKPILEQLLGLSKKLGVKQNIANLGKSSPMPQKGFGNIEDIVDRTELGIARMKNQQVLKKHGIKDPDKQGMVDPVSALLNYFSKN